MTSETTEIRQFSYDPLKAIIKFSELEKREQLSIQVKGLQKIETLFPHRFDKVQVGCDVFRIKIGDIDRYWSTYHSRELQDRDDSKESHCVVNLNTKPLETKRFKLKTFYDVPMLKLLKWYLRNGSKIDVLFITGVPPRLSELGNIKLNVKKLHLNRITQVMLQTWLSLIRNEEPFQEMRFNVNKDSLFLFQEPVVRDCTTLKLRFFDLHDDSLPLEECFGNLQNPHVNVEHSAFPMQLLKVMIRKWVITHRPLGTSFTLGIQHYTTVLDAFDMAVTELKGVPSTFPDVTNYCKHCCTIAVDGELEVVMFGGRKIRTRPQNFEWELKVEVMKKGTTVPK